MNFKYNGKIVVFSMLAGLVVSYSCVSAEKVSRNPRFKNFWFSPERGQKVAGLAPGNPRNPPENIFTKEYLKTLRQEMSKDPDKVKKTIAAAQRYVTISEAAYREMIIPYSSYLGIGDAPLVCPFCGNVCSTQTPQLPNRFDINKPFQVIRTCCDTVIYEREQDYPSGYKYKPNGVLKVTHMDGKEYDYPYWKGTDRLGQPSILFPRSTVWLTRMQNLRYHVIRSLADAYLAAGDENYAQKLIVIYQRFAEIYPNLPLWFPPAGTSVNFKWLQTQIKDPKPEKTGLAYDAKGEPLTLTEFEKWPRPSSIEPFWLSKNRFGEHLRFYFLRQVPRAFLVIKASKSMRQLSREQYGNPDELENFIRKNFINQIVLEQIAGPPVLGNYSTAVMAQAVYLGIAVGNTYLYNLGMRIADVIILNHIYPDIAFQEGSILYIAMMAGYHKNTEDMLGAMSKVRDAEFPFSKYARENMWRVMANMSTYSFVQSGHGDGNDSSLITGMRPGKIYSMPGAKSEWRDDIKYNPDDKTIPASRFLPSYGFAVLSSGRPGHRLESMLLFDRSTGHCHCGRLNLQLAFEGMLVAPECGYCAWWRTLDTSKSNPAHEKLMKIPYRYKLLEKSTPRKSWYKIMDHENTWSLSHAGALQNIVLVNERPPRGWLGENGFGQARTLSAPVNPETIAAALQVAEADDIGSMARAGISCPLYRRAVMNITGPAGKAYMVDLFRVWGGKRHVYQFKFPRAELITNPLKTDKTAEDAQKHLDGKPGVTDNKIAGKIPNWSTDKPDLGFQFIKNIKICTNPPRYSKLSWLWDPSLKKTGVEKLAEPKVEIDMHTISYPYGNSQTEIWLGKADYPMQLKETIDGKLLSGGVIFENGMSTFSEYRQGDNSLFSKYTHIFELHKEGEAPAIKTIIPLKASSSKVVDPYITNSYTAAINVKFTDGGGDIVVSAPDSEWREITGLKPQIKTAARFALLRVDDNGEFQFGELVDGRGFEFNGLKLESAGGLSGEIVDIIGDITGTRKQSAIIIKPYGQWPTGTILKGERIHLEVLPGVEDVYTVANVVPAEKYIRVEFEGTPPLGYHWDRVKKVYPENPAAFEIAFGLMAKPANNQFFDGKRVYFPALDLELNVRLPYVEKTYAAKTLEVSPAVDLTELGVEAGTPFVIYGMAPGQRVRIPSRIAVRSDTEDKITVQSNVDCVITKGEHKVTVSAQELAGKEQQFKF